MYGEFSYRVYKNVWTDFNRLVRERSKLFFFFFKVRLALEILLVIPEGYNKAFFSHNTVTVYSGQFSFLPTIMSEIESQEMLLFSKIRNNNKDIPGSLRNGWRSGGRGGAGWWLERAISLWKTVQYIYLKNFRWLINKAYPHVVIKDWTFSLWLCLWSMEIGCFCVLG